MTNLNFIQDPIIEDEPLINGCWVDIADTPQLDPVYLDANYNLIQPFGRSMAWFKNEKTHIACTGTGNRFSFGKFFFYFPWACVFYIL
jgi:hypothetical protein